MTEIVLTPKERQVLRAQAHTLDPVVLLGAHGLTDAVMREIDRALNAHELIKVRVPVDDRDEREQILVSIAGALGAARVQVIGKLLVLYRPRPDEPEAPPPVRPRTAKSSSRSRLSRDSARAAPGRAKPAAGRGAPRRPAPKRRA